MGFEFTVRGFQSIRQPVRVVVDGYCTIEGESNLGKSALIRALHAALSNREGIEFLPDDEKACEVEIQANGHVLTWYKDRKSTRYQLDGQNLPTTGRGAVPDEVKLIGLSPLRTLDKVLHWPQISFQWEQPFLIGAYKDTIAAELLGASAETSKITRAIKLVNTDVSRGKTRVELLEDQYREISKTVQAMEGFALVINAAQQVADQTEQERTQLNQRKNVYETLVKRYRVSWSRWKILNPLRRVVLPPAPDCTRYQELATLQQDYNRTTTLIDLAVRCRDVTPVVPVARQRVTELLRLDQELTYTTRRVGLLRSGTQIPVVPRTDWPATVARLQTLRQLQEQYLHTQRELTSATRILGEINQSLKSMEMERKKIEYTVTTMERCPLCAAPMKDGKYCTETQLTGSHHDLGK